MNSNCLSRRAASFTLALVATAVAGTAYAQKSALVTTTSNEVKRPANPMEIMRPLPIRPPRWIEDYRFLDDESKRIDFFDPIRYHRLSDTAWIQFGAEARYRADTITNPVFGLTGINQDNYMQQRLQAHSDLHLWDDAFRVFVQIENTRTWNKEVITPVDESRTEFRQAFFDVNLNALGGKVRTRIGRQEMAYGSFAFTNYRDATNIRLSFDGARVTYNGPHFSVEVFGVRPIVTSDSNFDDGSNNNVKFYGLYGTFPISDVFNVDAYGFGLETDQRTLVGVTGSESRYTSGLRLYGKRAGWDWGWDFAHQSGTLGEADIDAWTVTGEAGYTFTGEWKPRLALRLDAASGDDDLGDDEVGVFDPMFPKNGTYGGAGVTTLANNYVVGPVVSFVPRSDMAVHITAYQAWKESTDDGVYVPGMVVAPGTTTTRSSDIGQIYNAELLWRVNPNTTLRFEYGFVRAGEAITEAGGSDLSFGEVTAIWRF